ncbi:MAG: hypothetical protein OYK82_15205 [Gammaproteobacteria bacterium]|nr:hypothetical protein [Gammaproteobacteria bacterium]
MSDGRLQVRSWRDGWRYWKVPICFGAGFAALQLFIAMMRFGSAWVSTGTRAAGRDVIPAFAASIAFGFGLFVLAGILAGLILRWSVRETSGTWRFVLVVAGVLATPLALWFSLAGGLLGPPGVIIGATAPYLIFVGIPAIVGKLRGYGAVG